MRKTFIFLCVFAAPGFVSYAQHASSSANQTVMLTLSNAISITFSSTNANNGAVVNLPFSNLTSYANGVASSLQQLKIQSNKSYNISVAASGPSFEYSGAVVPAPVMPVNGVLSMQVAANNTGGNVNTDFNGTYASLSNTPQSIITGGGYGNNSTLSIQYEANPGLAYPSGTYSTSVVYTASQP